MAGNPQVEQTPALLVASQATSPVPWNSADHEPLTLPFSNSWGRWSPEWGLGTERGPPQSCGVSD